MNPNNVYYTNMDGNAWFCHGPDFEDLQTSSCYAFGETEEEAIQNYLRQVINEE